MAALASAADLEGWLGLTFDATATARAEAILTAVSSLVRSETTLTWDEDPVPDAVHTVVLQVAARVFNNPGGVRAESVGTYSVTYADPATTGLYLTASEKAILGRYRAQQRGLWSMSTTRSDTVADELYVPVIGGPPFPWYDS